MRKPRVTSPIMIRVSPTDRKLLERAAERTDQPLSTWARGIVIVMALWQLEDEKEKMLPVHREMLHRMHQMGVNPLRTVKGKAKPTAA